jgi:hypothetical protein
MPPGRGKLENRELDGLMKGTEGRVAEGRVDGHWKERGEWRLEIR